MQPVGSAAEEAVKLLAAAEQWARSRAGITWRTVASARSDASPTPATVPVAVCRATATATACSLSNSSGGRSLPASSR